jgi:hypothetical protein
VPATTFPGTVTPLRGLNPFQESERDVLFGRDGERDDLTRLVTAEGFRAGLLYGDSGVGKTSLLRAGLVPHLRDHGVVALMCEDIYHPEEAFAYAMGQATGHTRGESEPPIQFLARVLSDAMAGQMYLFILDEVDIALRSGGPQVVHELAELFSRVVSRSAGRARFLFSCASERLHSFSVLERRTGSLFPPSARYELSRFQPDAAAFVLERTLSLAGSSADSHVAGAIATGLAEEGQGAVLPADLQISALAVLELGIADPAALSKIGGVRELESAWLRRAAAVTGDERASLRLMAELALSGGGAVPLPADDAAARASVDPSFARHAFQVLADKGVARAIPVYGAEGESEVRFSLSHELLAHRVREVAAPARAAARRVFELLGSKAQQNRRLTAREWYQVWREGVTPGTPAERAVLDRTKRFAMIVAGVAAGVPLIILIVIYVSLVGNYYLATGGGHGSNERVLVRSGRAGLSAFHWLPPGFGDVVADTGFSRAMIDPKKWGAIADNDLGGDRDDGGYVRQALEALRPDLRGLIEYAATGSEASLEALVDAAKESPDSIAALLADLAPIARGIPKEVAFVQAAASDPSPAVQSGAMALAAAAERRKPGIYRATLASALASGDAEMRKLAFAVSRGLPDDTAQALYKEALALEPEPAARRELLGLLTSDTGVAAPTASSALAMLTQKNATGSSREKARAMLRRAFATAPADAAAAAVRLSGDEGASNDDRVLALELLLELAPPETFPELVAPSKKAMASKPAAVQAAALPLYARVSPQDAAGDLAMMMENQALPAELKIAMALAWGEVAKTKNKAAQGALEQLIEDPNARVRAAAAEAYGNSGRVAQDKLIKMVKGERYDVSIGAARGLANSAEAGGSVGNAVGGIYQLWKRKGKPRREAARIYARMARTKPGPVGNYLASASVSSEDSGLHPIAVEGLCNAMVAGDKGAPGDLARAVKGGSVEVRRLIIECVADNPKHIGVAGRIAVDMADDADGQIRAEAARVLAAMVADGKARPEVGERLGRLAKDDNREVRLIAIRALSSMGGAAPPAALEALPRAFENGDETERLAILRAARELGAGDLAQMASADPSPLVRVAAIDTAIATKTGVAATVNSALSDPEPTVRSAALARLASGKHGLGPEEVDRALGLAIRDPSESISVLALTTLAKIGEPAQVVARLQKLLESPSERDRSHAATAARGLAERDAEAAIELLERIYDDPSRDVRAAMLRSLATAYAFHMKPDQLAKMLRNSESQPTRRLVATAAFLVLAENKDHRDTAVASLEKVVKDGPPLAKLVGRLGLGLISSSADGFGFLTTLVP